MNDKVFAICVIAGIVLLAVTERKTLLSVSAIGAFFVSHVILLAVGLLATPWLIDTYMSLSFPYLHVEYFSDTDVKKAITLVTGGVALTVAGYRAAMMVDAGDWRTTRDMGLLAQRYPIIGIGIRPAALMTCMCLCLVIIAGVLVAELPSITAALAGGLEGEAYYNARFAIDQHGRLFAYAALNVLPFLAACIAGTAWYTRRNLATAYVSILLLTTVSVLTFKKSFLLNDLLVLFATWYCIKLDRTQWQLLESPGGVIVRGMRRKIPKAPLIIILALFFSFATASYYLVAAGSMSLPLAIGFAFERVFSRLTMMALMYAHYFPDVGNYYGLGNVGLLSNIAGTKLYDDTIVTLQYFERVPAEGGSGACGALIDFYGAFGWPGWIILSSALGVALYWVDHHMRRLPPLLINRVFHIFVLLTVTFLPQASIFRTLSTYGGGVVLALWLLLSSQKRLRLGTSSRSGRPTSSDIEEKGCRS